MPYGFGTVSQTLWARGGKRAFDCIVAGLILLLVSPVLGMAIILVRVTSPGPAFFVQDRSGRHGNIFRLYKLRTMRGNRKPDPKELVPLDHPEITPLGRVLRRSKIDELPQLINVLKGEMSLIGPRPTLPDQVEAYDDFRRQRTVVRPGITGLAQVRGGTALSWDERILYDIAYVRRCSLGLDLRILSWTLLVVVVGEALTTRRFADSPFAKYVDVPEGYSTAD